MRISRLELHSFPVPFRTVFRHASAKRARAENLIVAAYSDCGRVGYGEGCPRKYVTGETVRTGIAFFAKWRGSITDGVSDVASLREWIAEHAVDIDDNPAAFCAIELAVLDLLGRVFNQPIDAVLGLPELGGEFEYSAVLGDSPYLAFWWQHRRYKRYGFRDFKIKLSGNHTRDQWKLRLVHRNSDAGLRVRLDANNLWSDAEECARHINGLQQEVFAIEEPLQARDLGGFKQVSESCRTKIILDESVVGLRDLEPLTEPERWIINLRVSKMGGVIRSLALAETATKLGLKLIVGAQVGETSILTRAAVSVMNAVRPNLVAAEGAFGTHLLKQDLTEPCIMFGEGGRLTLEDLHFPNLPGLGLTVSTKVLLGVKEGMGS